MPIPVNNEKVEINKEIELEIKNDILKDSNKNVKIISVLREDEMYNIELQFLNNDKEKIQITNGVVVPAGESISKEAEGWFEGGFSGGMTESGMIWTFKLPYPQADKLYIKVLGREYKIHGSWNISIE